MKKVKQILAIIGVIILVGLYISTIVCAVSASENFMNMLMTSIYASVIIPVLIWAYSFIYKLIKKDSEEKFNLYKYPYPNLWQEITDYLTKLVQK
jgi:hypothetical protein